MVRDLLARNIGYTDLRYKRRKVSFYALHSDSDRNTLTLNCEVSSKL